MRVQDVYGVPDRYGNRQSVRNLGRYYNNDFSLDDVGDFDFTGSSSGLHSSLMPQEENKKKSNLNVSIDQIKELFSGSGSGGGEGVAAPGTDILGAGSGAEGTGTVGGASTGTGTAAGGASTGAGAIGGSGWSGAVATGGQAAAGALMAMIAYDLVSGRAKDGEGVTEEVMMPLFEGAGDALEAVYKPATNFFEWLGDQT